MEKPKNGADVVQRVQRVLASPAGEKLLAQLEEENRAAVDFAAERRRLAERSEAIRRRKTTEVPQARRVEHDARAQVEELRRSYKVALAALKKAAGARMTIESAVNREEREIRRGLLATADPRIVSALEALEAVNFRDVFRTSLKSETRKELMRTVQFSNRASIEAWGVAVDAGKRALVALALQAEPPEDLEEQIEAIGRRTAQPPEFPLAEQWRVPAVGSTSPGEQ